MQVHVYFFFSFRNHSPVAGSSSIARIESVE